jgi:hypothetical protein
MKNKSIVLIFMALIVGVSFVAYSTKAQKTSQSKKDEPMSNENIIKEMGESAVCTTLYQNILSKETNQWNFKKVGCNHRGYFNFLQIERNKEKLEIIVIGEQTPESAKSFLEDAQSERGISFPSKEFGDDGLKHYEGVPVDKSLPKGTPLGISFIKGRFIVHISCKECKSEETFKRFAGYALTALEGQ